MAELETQIKEQARALGFELVGIAPATPADGFDRLRDWLGRGFAGGMDYMHRHAEARRHPSSVLPEGRSVVMVGMSYLADPLLTPGPPPPPPPAPLPPPGERGAKAPAPSPPTPLPRVRGEGRKRGRALPGVSPEPLTPNPSPLRGEGG